jgi:hypothetical protein
MRPHQPLAHKRGHGLMLANRGAEHTVLARGSVSQTFGKRRRSGEGGHSKGAPRLRVDVLARAAHGNRCRDASVVPHDGRSYNAIKPRDFTPNLPQQASSPPSRTPSRGTRRASSSRRCGSSAPVQRRPKFGIISQTCMTSRVFRDCMTSARAISTVSRKTRKS